MCGGGGPVGVTLCLPQQKLKDELYQAKQKNHQLTRELAKARSTLGASKQAAAAGPGPTIGGRPVLGDRLL